MVAQSTAKPHLSKKKNKKSAAIQLEIAPGVFHQGNIIAPIVVYNDNDSLCNIVMSLRIAWFRFN